MTLALDNSIAPSAPAAETYRIPQGTVTVGPCGAEAARLRQTDFANHCLDHRYYHVVAEGLRGDFGLQCFVFHDAAGTLRGVQPFFVINQDILAGTQGLPARTAQFIRQRFPRFLTLRTLMVGNPAGPGHLGASSPEDRTWMGAALHEVLHCYARRHGLSLVVLKDFPSELRASLQAFTSNGYVRIPSMPMTCLPLNYASFDEYMQKVLSKATRKNLRRKFKKAEEACGAERITMEVISDLTPVIDEAYPLYLQVYERAKLKFEKLTPEYLCGLGQRMPERARFFLWRKGGRLIAFSVCLVQGDAFYDLYIGLEYPTAHELQLYFLTLRDLLTWCIAHGIRYYYSTPLNYESKLHLRCDLVPQDLYVMHTNRLLNPIFRRAIRLAEPTRHDPTLRKFRNATDLI